MMKVLQQYLRLRSLSQIILVKHFKSLFFATELDMASLLGPQYISPKPDEARSRFTLYPVGFFDGLSRLNYEELLFMTLPQHMA